MLKHRIITALVLVPLLLLAIFVAPAWMFELVVAGVMLGAAWEWSVLMNCISRTQRFVYVGLVAIALAASAWWLESGQLALAVMMAVALAWWVFVLTWLALSPQSQPARAGCAFKGACGLLILVPTFVAIVALHGWDGLGPERLLFLLALVWLGDVGAYFAGRRFGQRKLAPLVSPGKTWEGVAGAFVMAALVTAFGWYVGLGVGPLWYFVILCLMTLAVSIVGDLAESMFKRQQGVKDSGSLLPGHGGLLDRIDSITSAAPLFVGGLLLAQVFI